MRKLSEVLKVTKELHTAFGGRERGMCEAAWEAYEQKLISRGERVAVENFSEELLELFEDSHGEYCVAYLDRNIAMTLVGGSQYSSPVSRMTFSNEMQDLLFLVWEAIIDKLEHDGK